MVKRGSNIAISAHTPIEGRWDNPFRVVIAFVADPRQGSEEGVGWGFIRYSAELCRREGTRLVVITQEDQIARCIADAKKLSLEDWTTFIAVDLSSVARAMNRLWGGRISFLMWNLRVQRVLAKLAQSPNIKSVHQANYATCLFQNGCPSSLRKKFIWGPIAVPNPSLPFPLNHWAQRLIDLIVRQNIRGVRLLVANNDHSYRKLSRFADQSQKVVLEPNTFVEGATTRRIRSGHMFITVGLLIRRKRTKIAIRTLADPRLDGYTLQVVGDGPKRKSLERFVKKLGLQHRVTFLGNVSRDMARILISQSRLLLHPSSREGAPFVIGEAASAGTPAVAFENTGSETMIRLSENGGVAVHNFGNRTERFVTGILRALEAPLPAPSGRWQSSRFIPVLQSWWGEVSGSDEHSYS